MAKTTPFNGVGGMWPLFTKADLMARWGITAQRLTNWEARHEDFPPRIVGVIAGELPVYGRADVETYEKGRGGITGVASFNAALGNRA